MTPVWKELRTFAWPAAGIIALVVLPMVWASMFEPASAPHHLRSVLVHAFQVSAAGFLLGSALLAALPFGAEFQHRTMVQLLAQPVSRASLWLSKHGPLALVLTVIGVAAYAAVGARAVRDGFPVAQASFLLVMFCSAGLWTLVAGSTIGGAVFSLAGLAIVEMGATFVTSRVTGLELDPFDAHPALVTVRLMYAAGTLWLGWRMFARYEVKAIGEGGAPIASGVFERLAVLRSRPAGAIANLVRKEMRLQQPTFLIAALFAAVWLAAMLFFSVPPARPNVANVVFTLLLVSYYPLAIVVCGTISIGEETSLATRSWHLTLPVPSLTQWAVKLGVTLAVGGLLAVALPLILARFAPSFVALPAGEIQLPPAAMTALAAGLLIVISFWSATLFAHTVRAAVAVGIFVPLLWIAAALATLIAQRWGPGGDLLTYLMVANQWSPQDFLADTSSMRRMIDVGTYASGTALVMLALRQSLIAFRAVLMDRGRIARFGLQLVAATMVLSFIPVSYLGAVQSQYRSQPVRELESALQQISTASLAATGRIPESMDMAEIEATGYLSDATRRWLAGSRVSLELHNNRIQMEAGETVRYVLMRVSFPNGHAFGMFYRVPAQLSR